MYLIRLSPTSHLCRHCVVGPLRTPSMLDGQTNFKKCNQLICLSPSQIEEQWFIQSKWREEVRNGGKISLLAAARSHTKIKAVADADDDHATSILIGRPTTDVMPSSACPPPAIRPVPAGGAAHFLDLVDPPGFSQCGVAQNLHLPSPE